jgi:tetratricopeptide (TPR) repeat protein
LPEEAPGLTSAQVESGTAAFNRGLTAAQRGDHQAAIHAFTEALQLDPHWPNAKIARARSLLAQLSESATKERFTALERELSELITNHTDLAEPFVLRGRLLALSAQRFSSAGDPARQRTALEQATLDFARAQHNAPTAEVAGELGRARIELARLAATLAGPAAEPERERWMELADRHLATAISELGASNTLHGTGDNYLLRGLALITLLELATQGSTERFKELALEAIVDLTQATRSPRAAQAYYARAKVYELQGYLDDAMGDYRQAVRLAPGDPRPIGSLASLQLRRSDAPELMASVRAELLAASEHGFRQVIALVPLDPRGYQGLGSVLERRGRIREALACYEQAIAQIPGDRELPLRRASAALELLPTAAPADREHLLALIEKDASAVLANDADHPQALLLAGRSALMRGELVKARQHFDRAIVVAAIPAAYLYRALARHQAQDSAGAERDIAQTLAASPGMVEAYVVRGAMREQQGRISEAFDDYTLAVLRQADHLEARLGRVRILRAREDREAAVAELDTTLAFAPKHTLALAQRGELLLELGRIEPAIADLILAVSQPSATWHNWLLLATAHERKGDITLAREAMIQARARAPREEHATLDHALERLQVR